MANIIKMTDLLKEKEAVLNNQLKNYHGKINVGISWKSFKNRYASEKSLSLEYFLKIFETRNCNFILR